MNLRVGKTRAPGPSDDLAFEAAVRLAGECEHGIVGGAVFRVWAGSPSCAFCRLGNPDLWVTPHYAGHGVFVCEFGILHSRCRCFDAAEQAVTCDTPDKHRPKPARRRRTIRPRAA